MKAKIEHETLDSKIATATALFNEWVKWCEENDVHPRTIALIPKLFEMSKEEYDNKNKRES